MTVSSPLHVYGNILIYLQTMGHYAARAIIAHRLKFSSYIIIRIAVPLAMYIPLSMSYGLVSVAYNLPFDGK